MLNRLVRQFLKLEKLVPLASVLGAEAKPITCGLCPEGPVVPEMWWWVGAVVRHSTPRHFHGRGDGVINIKMPQVCV